MENKKMDNLLYIFIILSFFIQGVIFQSHIIDRKYIFIIYFLDFLIISYTFLKNKKDIKMKLSKMIDIRDFLLIISMTIYRISTMIYYPDLTDKMENIMWMVLTILMYLFGKTYAVCYNKIDNRRISDIALSFGSGLMVFNIVSMISYYFTFDEALDIRAWKTFMAPSSNYYNATIYTFYTLIFIGLFVYGMALFKKNKLFSIWIMTTGLFSAVWHWVVAKTRLPLLYFIISIFISIIIYYVQQIRINGLKKYKKTLIILCSSVISVAVIAILFVRNVSFINEWYSNSILTRDGGIFNNIRFKWAMQSILAMRQYPFGGNQTKYSILGSPHVSWCDIGYRGGILPFVAYILWVILIFKDSFSIAISNSEYRRKLVLIMPFISVFIYSCTEGLTSSTYVFSTIPLFAGIIRGEVLSHIKSSNTKASGYEKENDCEIIFRGKN